MCSVLIMAASNRFICPLCPNFISIKFHQLLSHIQLIHSGRPGFSVTCGIEGCQRLFRKMKTYRNHIYKEHMINFTDDIVYQPMSQPSAVELNTTMAIDTVDDTEIHEETFEHEPSDFVKEVI